MALSDQEGNELSSLRSNGADPVKSGGAAPGQPGGPAVAQGQWVGDHQAHKNPDHLAQQRAFEEQFRSRQLVRQPAFKSGEITYADRTPMFPPAAALRKFEVVILQVEDEKGLDGLQAFLNEKGEEGWEPFQIIPAANRGGKLVHYVHLKREKL